MYTAPTPTNDTPDLSTRFFMPTMEEILMLAIVIALFVMRSSLNSAAYTAALAALVVLYVYKRMQQVEKYCAKCMN